MNITQFSAPALPRPGDVPSALDGALFRLLVEHVPDAIFLIDLENEICTYVSPAVQRLLGRAPADLVGRSLTQFVHPHDTGEVLARSLRRRESRGFARP